MAETIELTPVLQCLPARLRVYGIEGRRFEPGVEISPEVQRAIEDGARRIVARLNASQQGKAIPSLDL